MNVKFGINFIQDAPLEEVIRWWQLSENQGFEWVGIPDSPILARELWVSCTAFAMSTKTAGFSPMVSNPVSRHPSVTAGALFSLDELAPGRVSLGIGTGDSALYGIGLAGAKLSYLANYIKAIKGLLRGEEVEWEGKKFKAEWKRWAPPKNIPVYVSCHGPLVTQMAGEVADGVISGHGLMDENIAFIEENIALGASRADRSIDNIDVWQHPIVIIAENKEEAVERLGAGLSHFLARFTLDGKQIPDKFKEPIGELARGWKLATHGRAAPNLAKMARDLGVQDYLVERGGGQLGSPQDIADGIEKLINRGVKRLMFLPLMDDKETAIKTLGGIIKGFG